MIKQWTIHWNKYNTLKLGNNMANKETSKQNWQIYDVVTSFLCLDHGKTE